MRTVGRYLTLAALSAFTAEFLLGDQYLGGVAPAAQQVVQFILFTAFYGSAAVLIREIARRTGRGWPTILVLAFAFGVFEEGIVDQSLFNPDFAGEHLLAYGAIPWLGIAGPWTIYVISLHVVWSIATPIAIAEALFPRPAARRAAAPQTQAPWLGLPALIALGILGLLAATAIFSFSTASGFSASPAQLIVSAAVAVLAIVAALRLPRRSPRPPRSPWPAFAISLVLCSAYQLASRLGEPVSPWLTVAVALVLIALGIGLSIRLRLDVLGLAAGAFVTYCWLGLVHAASTGTGAVIEQTVLVVVAVVVLALALARHRSARRAEPLRRPPADDAREWSGAQPAADGEAGRDRREDDADDDEDRHDVGDIRHPHP
jgi:hypothetical protein